MNSPRKKPVDLEKALSELEVIVTQLEAGEQPLDKSLKDFERGVRLSRECQGALKEAEQRVQILLGGELKTLDRADDDPEQDDGPDASSDD